MAVVCLPKISSMKGKQATREDGSSLLFYHEGGDGYDAMVEQSGSGCGRHVSPWRGGHAGLAEKEVMPMEREEALSRFDVAIWRAWPPSEHEMPFIGRVRAPDAAAAVVAVMRVLGWTRAGHVAASDQGRRFVHRAYGVELPEEEPVFVYKTEEGAAMAKPLEREVTYGSQLHDAV